MGRGQEKFEIRITGKPAVAILIGIAAIFLWRVAVTNETVAPELEEALRQTLAPEYAAVVLPDYEAAVEENDHAKAREGFERLKSVMENISFPSLKSRGGGDHLYVRAEILVNGEPPPKGKSIRYFHFSHSRLLGYVYHDEAVFLEYCLPFMD